MGNVKNRGHRWRWSLKRALFLSASLHLITPILAAKCDSVTGWLSAEEIEVPEVREPIVFEFIEPAPGPEAEEVPETKLASTKRSVARSEGAADDAENDFPFSKGDSPVKEVRTSPLPSELLRSPEPVFPREPKSEEGRGEPEHLPLSPSEIRRSVRHSIEEDRKFKNRKGRSAPPGDLAFNTVDFEYAPYLLELKRRIEENWYPPVAFQAGLPYRGASVVRFAVEKDGRLGLLELKSGADHVSLDTAAMNSIRFGAPFPPLPDDFPEKRWVITCTFHYR